MIPLTSINNYESWYSEEYTVIQWCLCWRRVEYSDNVVNDDDGIKRISEHTVCPKKYAHGFCFAVLCCGYTLTDFPISIRLTSLALWQSNDCPSASKATLINMDKYFMWIHYERLHNHNKAKHNKTVCIFLGTYCIWGQDLCAKRPMSRAWTSNYIPQYLWDVITWAPSQYKDRLIYVWRFPC